MHALARRMHRHASFLGDVVLCGYYTEPQYRMERVKFGVPLESYCTNELPGPLLVLLIILNKDGCEKKDVFRAPGHEAAMRQLQHYLHVGQLINFEDYTINTLASVVKKFLRKIPGGIFTTAGELELFASLTRDDGERLQDIRNVIKSLPICTQKLLCMLLGTFKAIAISAEHGQTSMSSEAISVSVAPSFFQSCVADSRRAMLSDVQRFKEASRIMRFLIDEFYNGVLFDVSIYEYYARVSGRMFIINHVTVCSPTPPQLPVLEGPSAMQLALQVGKPWHQSEFWALKKSEDNDSSASMPALCEPGPSSAGDALDSIPELSSLSSDMHLSSSLEDTVFMDTEPSTSRANGSSAPVKTDNPRPLVFNNQTAKSLPQVHERQRARMLSRSEWFLSQQLPATIAEPTPLEAAPAATRTRRDAHLTSTARESTALFVLIGCLEFFF